VNCGVLLHTEVEGQPDDAFNRRVYVYNYRLVDRYNCEVVSLAVVTGNPGGVELGRYETERWGCQVVFRFPVVRLADWRGREAELKSSSSPFALVVRAQLKLLESRRDLNRKYEAKLELMLEILHGNASPEQTRNLLRFLDWLFKLSEELEEKLSYDVRSKLEENRMPYLMSWERIWEKRGKLSLVLVLLKGRMGELDEKLKARVEKLSSPRLDQLAVALSDFRRPADLERWLKGRKA
jgi:Domain of unknown function (DUF4351)